MGNLPEVPTHVYTDFGSASAPIELQPVISQAQPVISQTPPVHL